VARDYSENFWCAESGEKITAMITEVEAYDGPHDRQAMHIAGKKRNEPMFGEAGVWYVYLCYGVHEMLNIVTGPKEYPAAVLIRGVLQQAVHLNGPGKVTKTLKIGRTFNNKKAARASGLWIEDRAVVVAPRDRPRTARIGV
jgi:DNA-3-methyladenine glycosylase